MIITWKDADRFWRKVDIRGMDECWNWQAYTDKDGYGTFWLGNTNVKAHRFSLATQAQIEKELLVIHSCDNPSCVNPSHLRLGTPVENTRDMFERGRESRSAPKGESHPSSKLTADIAKEIRRVYVPYSRTSGLSSLGRKYGVTFQAIQAIINGRTWVN